MMCSVYMKFAWEKISMKVLLPFNYICPSMHTYFCFYFCETSDQQIGMSGTYVRVKGLDNRVGNFCGWHVDWHDNRQISKVYMLKNKSATPYKVNICTIIFTFQFEKLVESFKRLHYS